MQYLLNIFRLTAKNQMMEGKTEGRDPSRQVAREGPPVKKIYIVIVALCLGIVMLGM